MDAGLTPALVSPGGAQRCSASPSLEPYNILERERAGGSPRSVEVFLVGRVAQILRGVLVLKPKIREERADKRGLGDGEEG